MYVCRYGQNTTLRGTTPVGHALKIPHLVRGRGVLGGVDAVRAELGAVLGQGAQGVHLWVLVLVLGGLGVSADVWCIIQSLPMYVYDMVYYIVQGHYYLPRWRARGSPWRRCRAAR